MNKIYPESGIQLSSSHVIHDKPSRQLKKAEITDRVVAVFCKHLVRMLRRLDRQDDEKTSDTVDMLQEYANACCFVARDAAADIRLLEQLCAQDENLLYYPNMSSDQKELCAIAVSAHLRKSLPGFLHHRKIQVTRDQNDDLNKAISQVVKTVLNPSSCCCVIL